jgi:hypothetical protein
VASSLLACHPGGNGYLGALAERLGQHDVIEIANPPEPGGICEIAEREVIESLALSQDVNSQQNLGPWWRHRDNSDGAPAVILSRVGRQSNVATQWIEHAPSAF